MTTDLPSPALARQAEERELRRRWRGLTRAATFVAILTSPAAFVWLYDRQGWQLGWAIAATIGLVVLFRGLVDVLFRRFIPWPSLFGEEEASAREEDVLARRRAWFWKRFFFWFVLLPALVVTVVWLVHGLLTGFGTWWGAAASIWDTISGSQDVFAGYFLILIVFFFINIIILVGPLMAMGVSQIRGFEPGDADWGVRLEDVRGQAEAKEEVRKIVSLWQSGEAFIKAGGKRERGILFLGAPGTGKTMLAKAIATGFNSPFVSIPGSGFAQTFIGVDALIVRFLARKAKKLARKWGGQCIVFIDEIDAVGMRRSSLGGGAPTASPTTPASLHDHCFYGPYGALTPTGDLLLEDRAWRERLFAARAPEPTAPPGGRVGAIVNQMMPGMFGGGGQLALNQLLVVMDGIDNPPFWRRFWTNRVNTLLDASFVVPRRLRGRSLRVPQARPLDAQIHFIGATNVPLESLDPALTRPGRLGRHVWFRTPTKKDREDIFDLYLGNVDHDADLDGERARDELARITNGYAQPLDSQLLTPTGWITMGSVKVGDRVIGADGKPRSVIGVHPRGAIEVYRVVFNDGTSVECTADHLWSVDALDPRMSRRTLALHEMVERGLRWSSRGSPFYLPKLEPVELETSDRLPIDPYLLGLLLGDGGFTSSTPDLSTADDGSLVALQELLPVGVSAVRHGPRNWWLSSGSRRGVARSQPNPLTYALRDVGLWGTRGRDKFVPAPYLWAPIDCRLALLQGLMDTDGGLDYRRGTSAAYYSHSCHLAEAVAFLVRSLGGSARVRPKRDGFRLALDLPEGMTPFRLARKAGACRTSKRPFRKRVVRVEPVGAKPVQCITVDAEDGLYVTDGFTVTHNSPAMIEQVCSMALTYAQHDARERFSRADILEAMTTVESGTAVGIEYVPEETRSVAIHEAGHAAAAHVYMKGAESTRLSIRMRAGSLGHHQALEKEERFSRFRSEEMAQLVWTLGAMAAEHAFFGEGTTGVGGDVQSATARAAWMVGACAMAPDAIVLNGKARLNGDEAEERERIARRFQKLGTQIMNRTGGGGPFHHDPISGVLSDPEQRNLVAQMLGQAYVYAYALIDANKPAVERIADTLVERKEIYGDELLELLNSAQLKKPELDLAKETSWPEL